MRIGVLTAFWKRWELSQALVEYYAGLKIDGIELICGGCYSYDGHPWADMLDDNGWHGRKAPNRPIGRKLNVAMSIFRDKGVDAVMAIGSDDFASASWIRQAAKQMKDVQVYGTKSVYMYSPVLDRLVYIKGAPIGAGRFYRSDVLESVDWMLWNNGKDRALDASAMRRINWANPGWDSIRWTEDMQNTNGFLVDVKVGDPDQKNDNIWGFSEILTHYGSVWDHDPSLLESFLGTDTASKLRALA